MSDFTIGKIVPTTASNAVGKCVHGCPIGTCLACNTPLAKPIEVVSKEKYDAAIARVAELTKELSIARETEANALIGWTRLEAAHNAALIELSEKDIQVKALWEALNGAREVIEEHGACIEGWGYYVEKIDEALKESK